MRVLYQGDDRDDSDLLQEEVSAAVEGGGSPAFGHAMWYISNQTALAVSADCSNRLPAAAATAAHLAWLPLIGGGCRVPVVWRVANCRDARCEGMCSACKQLHLLRHAYTPISSENTGHMACSTTPLWLGSYHPTKAQSEDVAPLLDVLLQAMIGASPLRYLAVDPASFRAIPLGAEILLIPAEALAAEAGQQELAAHAAHAVLTTSMLVSDELLPQGALAAATRPPRQQAPRVVITSAAPHA